MIRSRLVSIRQAALATAVLAVFVSVASGQRFAWQFLGRPPDQFLERTFVYRICFDGDDPTRIFAGTDRGIFTFSAATRTWEGPAAGTDGQIINDIERDPSDANVLYAATASDGVWKSTDRGSTWRRPGPAAFSVNALAVDPFRPQTIYGGTFGALIRSDDGGEIWTVIPLFDGGSQTAAYVASLAVDPSSDGLVYAGTAEDGVFRSTDHGVSWTPTDPDGMITVSVNSVASDSASGMLYATLISDIGCPFDGSCDFPLPSLIRLLDGAVHWDTVETAPAYYPLFEVALNPSGGILVDGPDGVVESRDAGITWVPVGIQPFTKSGELAVSADGARLAVETEDGVWVYAPLEIAPPAAASPSVVHGR